MPACKVPSSSESHSLGQLVFLPQGAGQGAAPPHSCSSKEGSEPAHGLVDRTEPCTFKEEQLLPHIPTGQSKYCFQEGWRGATKGA